MRAILGICMILLVAVPGFAREIAGVALAETIPGEGGATLSLNGAGVRSKLFFKIYIAELYLVNPSHDAATILADEDQKMMVMDFLYDEVSAEKLVSAWNEGFAANLSEEKLAALADRIEQFNSMFVTVKKGDKIVLNYLPGQGTSVTIAGEKKGMVEGKDFADALFAIWLGDKPVTKELKKQLLG